MVVLSVVELEACRNYEITLDPLREDHYLVAGEQSELESSLARLEQIATGSAWSLPMAESQMPWEMLRHAEYLIPETVREQLSSQIQLRCEAAHLPWEMALAPTLVSRRSAPQLKVSPGEAAPALWAGCTHPSAFPWAAPMVAAALRGWSGQSVEDSGGRLLAEARAGAAYLVAGLSAKGELVLEDQAVNLPVWVPRQAHKAREVCRFVLLHLVDFHPGSPYERADQVARGLLELGVESVIISFWQPDLERLPMALERCFQSLRTGTVGQAFLALRESFPEHDGRLSRWAFGFYGNPELKGSELVPRHVGSSQSATTVPRFGKADYRLKVTAGPEAGREIPVFSFSLAPGQRLVLGKPGLKRCQIEIQDPALASEAFAFEWEGAEAYLRNLSKSPEDVTVDGLPVYGRLPMKGTQTIRSGNSEFLFTPVGSPSAASLGVPSSPVAGPEKPSARFQLVVVSGVEEDQGRRHPLGESATVVGREGTFVLHDPAVSREHVMVCGRGGLFFVNHMEAGDLVLNGVPVEEESELRHGDRLVLSATTSLLFVDSSREGLA